MAVEVGQIIEGSVTGITHFGAFVQLPENQSGLVHISEISSGFVKNINDFLSVGDTVEVKVLKMTPDGKINLSIRQASENEASVDSPSHDRDNQGDNDKGPQKPRNNFDNRPRLQRDTRDTFNHNRNQSDNASFDAMMSSFLKDSEDRLSSLRRNTEGKRGGRGGRRS